MVLVGDFSTKIGYTTDINHIHGGIIGKIWTLVAEINKESDCYNLQLTANYIQYNYFFSTKEGSHQLDRKTGLWAFSQ